MSVLTMYSEIIEALEEHYKYDEEILIDCMLYLQETTKADKFAQLDIFNWFVSHNICPNCGTKFVEHSWNEYHPYGDTYVTEHMTEMACPICDNAHGGEIIQND